MDFLGVPLVGAIVLLGVLIFIHELGHFLVGIWCGAGVEVFSIGFGPTIASFRRKDTEYKISMIPLGGFVKFAGSTEYEDVPDEFQGREFFRLSRWKRLAIIAAGPAANFLLAIAVYTFLGFQGLQHSPAVIGLVREASPAHVAGLLSGDQIVSVDGKKTKIFDEVRASISKAADKPIKMTVLREGRELDIEVKPEAAKINDGFTLPGERGRIGIGVGFRQAALGVANPNGPAAKAGFQSGDEILKFTMGDDQVYEVRDYDQMLRNLAAILAENKDFKVNLRRGSDDLTLNVDRSFLSAYDSAALLSSSNGLLPSGELVLKQIDQGKFPGLQPGDRLLALNGENLIDIFSLSSALTAVTENRADFSIERNGESLDVQIPLQAYDVQKPEGKVVHYKVDAEFFAALKVPEPYVERYTNPISALVYGIRETARQSTLLFTVLGGLITGDVPLKVLGGPVMIATFAGEAAKAGIEVFLTMMALISVNLAVVNLLPIPILDGGQMVLIGFEAAKGRRLDRKAIENFQKIGFVLVIFLMIIATYNDFSRFWSGMLRGLKGIF